MPEIFSGGVPKTGTKANGQNSSSSNAPSFISDIKSGATDLAQDIYSGVGEFAENLASNFRSKNLPGKATEFGTDDAGTAFWGYGDLEGKDWRVSLSMPSNASFKNSKLLKPLSHTGDRMVFPYTPTIILSHTANYNQVQPIHNNYPFFAYQNSSVDQLVITGQFYNQNSIEAQYWIACLHYLRSVTKMDYGTGPNAGTPPPIVKLNGYGEYVFKDTPVIVTNFTVDMPNEVDYVATGIVGEQGEPKIDYSDFASAKATQTGNQMDITWAPAESQFTVTCQPIYSRDKVEKFNYQSFVNGEGIKGGYV